MTTDIQIVGSVASCSKQIQSKINKGGCIWNHGGVLGLHKWNLRCIFAYFQNPFSICYLFLTEYNDIHFQISLFQTFPPTFPPMFQHGNQAICIAKNCIFFYLVQPQPTFGNNLFMFAIFSVQSIHNLILARPYARQEQKTAHPMSRHMGLKDLF